MMLAQQALTVNAGERRPAVPRHRPQPPDRHRVDDGHELRQAGPPPARVPRRARSAVARRAGRLRRRGLPGARRRRRRRRRRRSRSSSPRSGRRCSRRPPSWPTARSRGAPARRRWPTYTIPTITQAAEAAGRPAPRVIAALPVCVTDDVAAAHERAAKVFAVYGQLPSYRAMLDREGASGAADIAIIGPADEVSERDRRPRRHRRHRLRRRRVRRQPRRGRRDPGGPGRHAARLMARRVARAGLLGLTMTVVACSAGPGVRTEEASQRVEDTAPPTTTRPVPVVDGRLVDVPRPRPGPHDGVGVRVGRPSRSTTPTRPASRSRSR